MKENIEEAIKKLETISKIKKENEEIIDCATGCGIELILDYEKLQKENIRLRYQDIPYLEGEIKGYKTRIEELKKEKEELAYRCRNLDQEAQGYLEELVGDDTLTKRNIKELQEENKKLRETVEEYDRTFDVFNERTYHKKYLEERRAEQPNLLFPDADEIYERYYELKEENEELKEQNKYEWIRQHCLPQGLINKWYIPKQKIKDKIEEYKINLKEYKNYVLSKEETDVEYIDFVIGEQIIRVLQELLEEE